MGCETVHGPYGHISTRHPLQQRAQLCACNTCTNVVLTHCTHMHHKHRTIGYGDISAKTSEERSLAIFVMILGAAERGGMEGVDLS